MLAIDIPPVPSPEWSTLHVLVLGCLAELYVKAVEQVSHSVNHLYDIVIAEDTTKILRTEQAY